VDKDLPLRLVLFLEDDLAIICSSAFF